MAAGQAIVVLESMKMEHEVMADVAGTVQTIDVKVGDTLEPGQRLAVLAPAGAGTRVPAVPDRTLEKSRDDLEAVRARRHITLDAARLDALAGPHQQGLAATRTSSRLAEISRSHSRPLAWRCR